MTANLGVDDSQTPNCGSLDLQLYGVHKCNGCHWVVFVAGVQPVFYLGTRVREVRRQVREVPRFGLLQGS